ncbi:hypothetical protein niasHT_033547 [Heterodera trifolii]|uniref:Folate transporter 1 n=1 Tax=Heterodera trifolii TaxID=157864 RepID=A0ABD2HX05_9BILA
MHWKITVALACSFGVIKRFRLGSPFLTSFLKADKNFTSAQVYGEIYPFWTYSNFLALIPILVLTDLVRYKPIVALEAVSLVSCWLLLVFGTTLGQMQLMQICFGISTAAGIAYNTYLYAVVHKKHYKKVTSYLRMATMVGKFLAFCAGQVLISTGIGDFMLLNQLTLFVSSSLIPIVLLLPMPKKQQKDTFVDNNKLPTEQQQQNDVLLERNSNEIDHHKLDGIDDNKNNNGKQFGAKKAFDQFEIEQPKSVQKNWTDMRSIWTKIKTKFLAPYQNRVVFHWSLYSIVITAMVYQVQNYIQNLWDFHRKADEREWNGFVESINTLLNTLVVFLAQFVSLKWAEYRSVVVCCVSTMSMAWLLYAMVHFDSLFADYILYIVLYMFYNMLNAISSNLIATHLSPNGAYGLVFGINSFVALLLQSVVTLLIVDVNGAFALSLEAQFVTYSICMLASSFALPALQLLVKCGKK